MPTKVTLRLRQPDESNIASVAIYEASAAIGPFALLTTVNLVAGQVLEEVDVDATLATDWFAVQWKDTAGAWITPLSPPVRAGETNFIELVTDRALQRDFALDEDVLRQEAESAVELYFGKNPYAVALADIPEGKQYRTLNGLVYMVMARALMAHVIQSSSAESATLGLVSFKSGSNQQIAAQVKELMDVANRELGLAQSAVIDMERILKVYGGKDWARIQAMLGTDQEFLFLPWQMLRVELPRRGVGRGPGG